MKAYEAGDYPTTRRLRRVDRPDPAPGEGEALVRIRSTGPNARDFQILTTGMWNGPVASTHIPLCDMAGEVLAIGRGVTAVTVGDRVTVSHYPRWLDGPWHASMCQEDYGYTRDGFLRELAVLPAAALIRIPEPISFEEAGTLPSAGLTAWQAVVELGRLRPGETLVTTGTGGVSVFSVQWAKMLGARVIVTSSSDAKLQRMKSIGADEGINYRSHPNWSEGVLELTQGRGADVVVNNVGMVELDPCLESCASGARVLYVGASPVTTDRQALAPVMPRRMGLLILRDLTLKGVIVGSRRMFATMMDRMVEHDIHPIIDRRFDFEQANEALAYAATGGKIGKVVIRV